MTGFISVEPSFSDWDDGSGHEALVRGAWINFADFGKRFALAQQVSSSPLHYLSTSTCSRCVPGVPRQDGSDTNRSARMARRAVLRKAASPPSLAEPSF